MKSCAARWAADTVASQEIKPSATPSVRPGTTSRPRGRLFVWDYLLALWVKARWLGDDPCQRAATYRKPAPAVLCPQPCVLRPKSRCGHRAAGPPRRLWNGRREEDSGPKPGPPARPKGGSAGRKAALAPLCCAQFYIVWTLWIIDTCLFPSGIFLRLRLQP